MERASLFGRAFERKFASESNEHNIFGILKNILKNLKIYQIIFLQFYVYAQEMYVLPLLSSIRIVLTLASFRKRDYHEIITLRQYAKNLFTGRGGNYNARFINLFPDIDGRKI